MAQLRQRRADAELTLGHLLAELPTMTSTLPTPPIDAREVLRRLRWLERAESLLHELRHRDIEDPDVDAVAALLAEEVDIQRRQLQATRSAIHQDPTH